MTNCRSIVYTRQNFTGFSGRKKIHRETQYMSKISEHQRRVYFAAHKQHKLITRKGKQALKYDNQRKAQRKKS